MKRGTSVCHESQVYITPPGRGVRYMLCRTVEIYVPHVTGTKKETDEAMKIVDPNQSNFRILAMTFPFNRSTFKKNIIAMMPTPMRGRLIQKIHLQPEWELCANPLFS